MAKRVIWLVGASGAGKTTVARTLAAREKWRQQTYFFDSIGVPSPDEMQSGEWGGEGWQMWATRRWMDHLSATESSLALIEGQAAPSGIRTAAEPYPEVELQILLLDCSPEVRRCRLVESRGQPELANHQMDCWAAYLVGQAHALGLPVIDTSDMQPAETADLVETLIVEVERILKTIGENPSLGTLWTGPIGRPFAVDSHSR